MTLRFVACVILALVHLASGLCLLQQNAQVVHTDGGPPKKGLHHSSEQGGSKRKHKHTQAVSETLAKVAQPTGRPSKNETAAEATGVAQNEAGDLDAFIAALITNIVMICIFFIVASVLRQRYPLVYSKNALTLIDHVDKEEAALYPELKELLEKPWEDKIGKKNQPEMKEDGTDTFFGWWGASYKVSIDDVVQYRGLDQGMLLEFSNVAKNILLIIGLPMVLLVGPCHCFLGGYRAGDDYLSYWGMANVVDGHPWLYWAHSIILWLVIVTVQRMLYNAMREFIKRRRDWLQKLPEPRSVTVLVEGIPEKQCSDSELQAFFRGRV
jgi:hypothetical protein